ncbi:MAG TPA: hypothetical protein VGX68_07785 [Thermoanaerobaculia bacterium]|jgi:hypothetical protein|nr:hypothetical protein [Thermoanaerobaculia bacterium]
MKSFWRTLAFAFALTPAAYAGTVYIPLPGVTAVGSVGYETQVSVTNTLSQQRTVNYVQLATGVDGTQRQGVVKSPLQIAAGRTALLKPTASVRGLLELSAPPGFHYSARLVGTGGAAGLGVDLPVINSDTMGGAGGKLVIQGLKSLDSKTADVVIVNLAKTASSCTTRVLRADGTLAFPQQTTPLPPLSHRFFANIFSGVPGGISDARAEVTCTTSFFAFAQMTDTATGEFAVAAPTETSASTLTAPGDAPSALDCSVGTVCYVFPGLVHQSTNANPDRAITLAPAPASYKSVKVHLEVEVGPWNTPATGAHGVLYLVRNKNRDMFANIFLRGPGKGDLTLRHGFNQTHPEKAKIEKAFLAQQGQTYAFDYDYNPAAKTLSLRVSQNEQLLFELVDKPNISKIDIGTSDRIQIGLSNPGTNPTIEPASIGWKYSNLKVEFFP